jgi:hypothetical protein
MEEEFLKKFMGKDVGIVPFGSSMSGGVRGKEGFNVRSNPEGTIILEGPKEAWPGLAELLIGDFGEELE